MNSIAKSHHSVAGYSFYVSKINPAERSILSNIESGEFNPFTELTTKQLAMLFLEVWEGSVYKGLTALSPLFLKLNIVW